MNKILIDKTDRYAFYHIVSHHPNKGQVEFSNELTTYFVHFGKLIVDILSPRNEKIELMTGEGIVINPNTKYQVSIQSNTEVFCVTSPILTKSYIEIIDNGDKREELPILSYKIIKNPKKVHKPWGEELWILWTRDHFVLKKISTKAGQRSSLQYHEYKIETNFLAAGQAFLIEGIKVNLANKISQISESIKDIDFDKHKKLYKPGQFWTTRAGEIHRTIAINDCIMYEVSTPELDDVIRLSDDSGRASGRITSEHHN